ncbi:hypothetical protein [Streptomyces sp. NPDC046942]|uniref:hypothetical protein n=1 Tax=Streptomyces sp. NPDC046942 TaxID=3155137 RepID=UPI0033DC7AD2
MSVSHSVYAAYGVVIAPPRDLGALDALLEAQSPHTGGREPADVRVHLFTVGDSKHVILATGYAELEPNTYRAVASLTISAQWDGALREHVKNLGLTVRSGPCWHLVHDLS